MDENQFRHEDMIQYLLMIQDTINRRSTTSAILKGFAAAVVAGISSISFQESNNLVLILFFVPILCFWGMDAYYYQLEKKYRILYEKVRIGEIDPDFSMNACFEQGELKLAHAVWYQCLRAPCIAGFYIPISLVGGAIVILNFTGVI